MGQSPAEVVVISAADTELAALSAVRAEMDAPPTLRMASLMHLMHPMSVDLHLETCATKSKLVIARVLGGAGYWRYGLEQYAAHLHAAGVPFAALPGDDKPDEELRGLSTVSDADYAALWAYLVEGGPENTAHFLAAARAMARGDAERPPAAKPLLKAGLYWPGASAPDLNTLRAAWPEDAPVVPVVFYRALVQGGGLNPINRLVRALLREGLAPMPIFVASLKDAVSAATLASLFQQAPPHVILNATAFATGTPERSGDNPLSGPAANAAPVFQVVLSGSSEDAWKDGLSGLSARDIAMNVALPEVDGRILARAISFKGEAFWDDATECPIAAYQARGDRVTFTARLAAAWARLRATAPEARKVALILANYPNKDGRLANGVGLDTPAATANVLRFLTEAGYTVVDAPADAAALMARITSGPTNWLTDRADRKGGGTLPLDAYRDTYAAMPYALRVQIEARWGAPEDDPFFDAKAGGFKLSIHSFGHVFVGLQPARGYNIDPTETYHAPDLVPPHNYLAFYMWLNKVAGVGAVVHMGKHGNLEWLPGKAVALSEECWPEAVLGPVPHVYPFIVNDPGEGTQAKRRASAVIIDHLTPPLTRAETYGPLRDLEALVDEYYEAAGVDPRRLDHLRREILSLSETTGLNADAGFTGDADGDLARLDAYLCELKEAQIRDGLHVFGQAPDGRLERDLAVALLRLPREDGSGGAASLLRALAEDLALGFDPLDCDMAERWHGPTPELLVGTGAWRSCGDTVERLELLSARLLDGEVAPPGPASAAVLETAQKIIRPAIASCGPQEQAGLLTALAGQFVAPAPSGAPTRGRPDVLPTGRNFFSVDSRAIPTPTAWALGVEIGQPPYRPPLAGSRRLATHDAADRLGHGKHAHGWR